MKPIKLAVTVFTVICVLAAGMGDVYATPGLPDVVLSATSADAVAMSALSGVFPVPTPAPGGTGAGTSSAQTSKPAVTSAPASGGVVSYPFRDSMYDSAMPGVYGSSPYGTSGLLTNGVPTADVALGQADAAILERLIERIKNDTGTVNAVDVGSTEAGTTTDEAVGSAGVTDRAGENGIGDTAGVATPGPTPSVSATPVPLAPAITTAASGQQLVALANTAGTTEIPVDAASKAAGEGGTGDDTPDIVYAGGALIEVTNPYGDETVYKDSYSICGVRDDGVDSDEPIAVYLTRYDSASGGYTGFTDVDGDYCWTIGSNGVFTRSVLLAEGENYFALAACKASTVDAALNGGSRIEDGDIQVVKFTITYRAQNVAEKIVDVTKDLSVANILKEIENQ